MTGDGSFQRINDTDPRPKDGQYFITFRTLTDGQLEVTWNPEITKWLDKWQPPINSPSLQIAIKQQQTKQGLWALTIAQYGKQIFGDIYRTEVDAYAALPGVLAELRK